MITNRRPLSASFEPRETSAAEPHWIGLELSDKQAVVRGKRILVVDDEEPLRACLRMMLELDGHRVTEARNGAEALNLLTTAEFDLVITDFEMPVMKGNETEEKKNTADTKNLPLGLRRQAMRIERVFLRETEPIP